MALLTRIGIAACISQSAMLSGLNLAFFTVSKLELPIGIGKNHALARGVVIGADVLGRLLRGIVQNTAPAREIKEQFAELPK